MVIDLRYQVVTTVIIFLTLGLGILIGSSMVGQEGVIKEQKKLIGYLETNFSQLREKNRRFQKKIKNLQQKLEENNKFQQKIFPFVIQDRIDEKKVLVVYENEDTKEQIMELKQVLKIAGSKRVVVKPLNYLQQKQNFDSYDYLICLGERKIFSGKEIEKRFQGIVKKITYLSKGVFDSERKIMNYILKLSGDVSSTGSVEIE